MPTLAVIGGTSGSALIRSRIATVISAPDRFGLGQLAAGKHDRELIAADPRQRVGLAGAAAQHGGDLGEDAVPGRVAEGVVDLLEVVEVEHQQRPGDAVAVAARQLGPQVFLEAAPVLQPGERVLARLRRQFLHPFMAAPDEDERRQQRRQRQADDRDHHRQVDARAVRVADDEQPGAVGDVDWSGRGFVGRELWSANRLPRSTSEASTRSGSAVVAAAARSGTRKEPPAKPISAARRSATVLVGAPSRKTGRKTLIPVPPTGSLSAGVAAGLPCRVLAAGRSRAG